MVQNVSIGFHSYKGKDIKMGRNYETRSIYAPIFTGSKCKRRARQWKNSVYTACQLVVCSRTRNTTDVEEKPKLLRIAMNKHHQNANETMNDFDFYCHAAFFSFLFFLTRFTIFPCLFGKRMKSLYRVSRLRHYHIFLFALSSIAVNNISMINSYFPFFFSFEFECLFPFVILYRNNKCTGC